MTCFNELGKEFTAQKHAILPQHFVRAAKLPSSPNSRNLGPVLFCTSVGTCGLAVLHEFGVKDSKHQRLCSSKESILLGLAGKRGQGSSYFFEDSPNAKDWVVHVGTVDLY